ncbi:SGNH/GDSL hydrolase family protein [Streptomyces sp. H10-C2]|uniref:SGNH/GDSL hydrolase family protein n=1 Tax=unclassified Streptomyces TaxID=2593676 RepID=UPI0024B94470|nr:MULTISPECIES: SGNH/GDSL hydrolase family protein [unclassified Streptomyces]MDJ0343118.1 SGNH/GDSL hydrolase family protein [Streptomyces sp. PH10-H1]MDJ0371060.1 SGNH/GDSL hydrolase family protein [Streptomyces sp. H10-C2]
MRLSRFASAASALILTTGLALIGAVPAHATTPAYAALGDSYSAGVGAGSYDSASGSCKRSTKAYPALWAAAHAPSGFSFIACSGARTGDVVNNQLGALNSSTGLVSISIGGNDAGFSDVMTTCVLNSESTCLARIAQARAYADNTLPGLLDGVYNAIGSKAPNAHVVVLGYPHFYKIGGSCWGGLSDTSRAAINGAADELDTVISKRVADHGFTFADVRGTFTGHELCSGSPWLNSLTWPIDESYHPKAAGQSGGYLPAFSGAA